MGFWRDRPKTPPSVEHLVYFKIWAIANTISASTLIIILLCLIIYLTNHASNMAYLRYTVDSLAQRVTFILPPIKQATNAETKLQQTQSSVSTQCKEAIR